MAVPGLGEHPLFLLIPSILLFPSQFLSLIPVAFLSLPQYPTFAISTTPLALASTQYPRVLEMGL